MAFADRPKAQNEAAAMLWRAGLVGMRHDARIEQGRGLERIFMQKIGADQETLGFAQFSMGFERLFHLCGAHVENGDQIAVTTFEIFKYLDQLSRGRVGDRVEAPYRQYDWPGSYRSD